MQLQAVFVVVCVEERVAGSGRSAENGSMTVECREMYADHIADTSGSV